LVATSPVSAFPVQAGDVKIPHLSLDAKDGTMRTLSLRAILIIGFVVFMPLLALPAVARRLDDWLYGPPPQGSPQARLRRELAPAIESAAAEGVSPASYDEAAAPEVARRDPQSGLDGLHAPPPFDPLPVFDRSAEAARSAPVEGATAFPLAPAAAARLSQIRSALEAQGAEYILLETTEGSGTYRFHCQLRLSDDAPYTREFEATAAEPVAAAERVLAEVSAWRTAAREQNLR
jgi:hypothetical protein